MPWKIYICLRFFKRIFKCYNFFIVQLIKVEIWNNDDKLNDIIDKDLVALYCGSAGGTTRSLVDTFLFTNN